MTGEQTLRRAKFESKTGLAIRGVDWVHPVRGNWNDWRGGGHQLKVKRKFIGLLITGVGEVIHVFSLLVLFPLWFPRRFPLSLACFFFIPNQWRYRGTYPRVSFSYTAARHITVVWTGCNLWQQNVMWIEEEIITYYQGISPFSPKIRMIDHNKVKLVYVERHITYVIYKVTQFEFLRGRGHEKCLFCRPPPPLQNPPVPHSISHIKPKS